LVPAWHSRTVLLYFFTHSYSKSNITIRLVTVTYITNCFSSGDVD